jgi:endonuclease YncB( thermonuclease family)
LVNFPHLNGLESHARTNGRQRRHIATAATAESKVRAFRNRVKGDCGTEVIDEPFRRLGQNSTAWIQDVDRIATARQEQRFATRGSGESGGCGIRAKDRYRQRIKGHRHYLSMRTSGRTGSRHQRLVTPVYAVKVSDGRDDHWVMDSLTQ